jgi:ATP-binding cassette subfamily B protein
VVIAHRLFTIKSADHLIVIKDGKVIEEGSPAQLAATDGWFQQMLAKDESIEGRNSGAVDLSK